jgi:copper chaperone CopZ
LKTGLLFAIYNDMKNTIAIIISIAFFGVTHLEAQARALKTATYSIPGGCGECRKRIEAAASLKGVRTAQWDAATRRLTVSYRPAKVTEEAILRSVAYAGYDNEKYLAPYAAYSVLENCCRYEREAAAGKRDAHAGHAATAPGHEEPVKKQEPPVAAKHEQDESAQEKGESGIREVYDRYFRVKDRLVGDDGPGAAAMAAGFLEALDGVKMGHMEKKEHDTFMKSMEPMKLSAMTISGTKDLEKQRKAFSTLSEAVYTVMKQMKPAYEVYVDHCPMYGKGANWLSREKSIRNPYFGASMMTCGRVTETIR